MLAMNFPSQDAVAARAEQSPRRLLDSNSRLLPCSIGGIPRQWFGSKRTSGKEDASTACYKPFFGFLPKARIFSGERAGQEVVGTISRIMSGPASGDWRDAF
jgi:hypothetical protein